MKKKIVVRGPCLTQSGYGEHARMVLRALRTREDLFDIYIVPLGWGQTGWLSDTSEFRQWMDSKIMETQHYLATKQPFDISFQVTIPNEWEKIAGTNIGVCAGIETTKVAPIWLQKANMVDKVVVVSEHAKWGFENTEYDAVDQYGNEAKLKLTTPIEVVGYPVRDIVEEDKFEIELDYDYNYLVVGQWGPRKNLENLIKWWLEECWEDEVGLILKTSTRKNNLLDRHITANRVASIASSVGLDEEERKCKIYLLHGDLSESEMKSLYNLERVCSMITTTHGEGFGLPLFEFAQTGKPIVAPNWSGYLDFLTVDGKPHFATVNYDINPIQEQAIWDGVLQKDSMWCFPHEGSFKQRVRQVRKSSKWLDRSEALKENILTQFSQENQYKKFIDAVHREEVFEMSEWLQELESKIVEFE